MFINLFCSFLVNVINRTFTTKCVIYRFAVHVIYRAFHNVLRDYTHL